MLKKSASVIHLISAMWVFVLAFTILIDVLGRVIFSSPLPGTKEILQNSVIALAFLQLPLAIMTGSMFRTTMLVHSVPAPVRLVLECFAKVLGVALFGAIAAVSLPMAMESYALAEYEGEGALRIYVWPIRFLIVITSTFAAIAYVSILIGTLRSYKTSLSND
ncbi:MAG: TRAP transporter small permease [Henriciella sp.]